MQKQQRWVKFCSALVGQIHTKIATHVAEQLDIKVNL